jgi:hypothetical protein
MSIFETMEYREQKAFLAYFADRYLNMEGLAAKHRPIAALEELERMRPEKASEGLRMAINDCLEISRRWPAERVRAVDQEMQSAGVLTLSESRRRYSVAYSKILERAKITSEVDYYLVKGIRDSGSPDLSAKELATLDQLLNAYEERRLKRKHK